MASKKKAKKWFIKVRGSYLPNSWQGRLLYIPYLAYLIAVPLIAVNSQSELLTVVLFVVPQWCAAAIVMTWLASNKS